MKPTFQTSRPARRHDVSSPVQDRHTHAPKTDWSYQPQRDEFRGGSASYPRPSFHSLSDEFFAEEARKESRIEGAAFAVIVALAAWPIALAAQAAYELMK